jgi:RecJ-like exonuclease
MRGNPVVVTALAPREPEGAMVMSDTDRDDTKLNPGDQAKQGTPGTGENVCPECHGTGRVNAAPCPTCGGTGTIIEGVGGG